jgi:serine/threonine-protein kinase
MGVVYRARDRVLEREVALKLIRPERAGDAETRQRFLREARSAATLNHPGIATVYEAGETPATEPGGASSLFIAEELVQGETLAASIARGPLPIGEVVRFGAQMAEALGEAHDGGIVHRDVKPSNLMLTPDGQVKILDFGVARQRQWQGGLESGELDIATWSRTSPGVLLGTPAYMPPEQIVGESVDPRADVYAAGCVLYELLAGRPPFTGATTEEVLRRCLTETPRPVRELRPGVPDAMAAVVARALERDPRRRYANGKELAEALRTSGTETVTTARRPVLDRCCLARGGAGDRESPPPSWPRRLSAPSPGWLWGERPAPPSRSTRGTSSSWPTSSTRQESRSSTLPSRAPWRPTSASRAT